VALSKKVGSQEVAIVVGQTATNFGKIVDAQRFHVPFCPKMSQKWKKTAKNSPKSAKVAQKLRSVAKIARLHKNAKVAQKLRSATSQFSGGTTQYYLGFNHVKL